MSGRSLAIISALILPLGACAITDSGDPTTDLDASEAMLPVSVTIDDQVTDSSQATRPGVLARKLDDGTLTQGTEINESFRLMSRANPAALLPTPDVEASAVNCFVSASGPRRISAESVQFGVLMNCNGAISRATMFLYMFRRLSASDPWAGVASRGPEVFTQNLAGTSVTRTDAVCLPAEYVGVLDITVEFLDGFPRVIQSIFATPSIFIGC